MDVQMLTDATYGDRADTAYDKDSFTTWKAFPEMQYVSKNNAHMDDAFFKTFLDSDDEQQSAIQE